MTSLMEALKESTAPMHNSAEGSQFQGLLTNGKLPPEVYADYLAQLFLVHRELETEIKKHPELAEIVTADQYQEGFLNQDLNVFGRETKTLSALSATSILLDKIRGLSKTCPQALLGMHYVLLGSKHGGKFVAKNVQASYQLQEGAGNTYFDPYGPSFMPIWREFKERMNQMPVDESTASTICEAAADMFKGVTSIGEELMPAALRR